MDRKTMLIDYASTAHVTCTISFCFERWCRNGFFEIGLSVNGDRKEYTFTTYNAAENKFQALCKKYGIK